MKPELKSFLDELQKDYMDEQLDKENLYNRGKPFYKDLIAGRLTKDEEDTFISFSSFFSPRSSYESRWRHA